MLNIMSYSFKLASDPVCFGTFGTEPLGWSMTMTTTKGVIVTSNKKVSLIRLTRPNLVARVFRRSDPLAGPTRYLVKLVKGPLEGS